MNTFDLGIVMVFVRTALTIQCQIGLPLRAPKVTALPEIVANSIGACT